MGTYKQLEELLSENPWLPEPQPRNTAELKAFVAKVRGLAADAPARRGDPDHVWRQHVVSRCVQTYFTQDPSHPGSNLRAVDLDLLRKHETYKPGEYPTTSTGYFEDFVVHDSAGSEKLWKTIEDCIPLMVPALERGLPDQRDQRVARATVALHWARRLTTKALAEEALNEAVEKATAAAELALAVSGRPQSPDEIEEIRADSARTLLDLQTNGVLFRHTVERTFRRALSASQLGRLFILEAPGSAEFLIGDNPVTVHSLEGGHVPDLPLLDLLSMAMPITPRFMVQIERDGRGTGPVSRLLTRDEVEAWNRLQVIQAQQFVMIRPDAELTGLVQQWAAERPFSPS